MRKYALPRLVVLAAFILVIFSIAVLVATQIYSAYDVDRDAETRAEWIVSQGLDRYGNELAQRSIPQTYWDETVAHLDRHFDASWAGEYIGSYFWETGGFETALIVDRDGKVRYAAKQGTPLDAGTAQKLFNAASPMIAKVRIAEKARGPLPPAPIPDSVRIESIIAKGTVRVGGKIVLMSATLVQPDKFILPLTDRAPIVVLGKTIDKSVLTDLSRRFVLPGENFKLGTVAPQSDRAMVPLRDPAGQTIATLSWMSPNPGTQLLRKVAPVMALFALLLAAMTAWVIDRGNRMALTLIDREAEANRLAHHDPLTGLPNRTVLDRIFAKKLRHLAAGGTPFSVHCIDLDLFKSVNDSLGHLAGDELIQKTAARLRDLCRPDDFLARFGGDEFVIIQSNSRRARATKLAERIVTSLAEPVQLNAGRVIVGASVGIVVAADTSLSAEEYLRQADLALYRAKELGRNTLCFFDREMDSHLRTKQLVRGHLHDALAREDLKLCYQPQVNREGELVGLEALARWTHDELGEVPPSDFVAIAEESGLIDTLGQFTIRQAFADSRRWPSLTVAINVSAVQLRQRNFAEWIRALADEFGVDTRRFELEITESVVLGDDPQTHAILAKLRRYGFRIVLDDFGTGYSSLGYLQRYPIDKVKIDRSFVARIGNERGAEAVVVAIVRLARALGLDVVAEGVETDAQRLFLAVAGCSTVQGFLTGKPTKAEAISVETMRAPRVDVA